MRAVCLIALSALLAAPALAQQAPGRQVGLRYLDWPGKPQAASSQAGLRQPGEADAPAIRGVIPHARAVQTRPAAPLMTAADAPAPMIMAAIPASAPVPASTFAPASIYDAPPPVARAAPVSPVAASPIQAALPAAPVAGPVTEASTSDRPRLYSLHREYGEQPDRTQIPAPVYLDALPVDLAAPPPEELKGKAAREQRDAEKDPDRPDRTDGPQ
ncbi:MAG: hypothetical protein JSR45_18145 [Proteobacteria bacterium]|nr:hypothetical protein [Pseudomonadota bacterium]